MSGYISEFFGYRAEDTSDIALQNVSKQVCPFLSSYCTKALGDKARRTLSGVCSVRQVTPGSPDVICCPNRIYAENYKMLSKKEQEVFKLLASGKTSKEIAEILGKAEKTIVNQRSNIYGKLDLHDRLDVIEAAQALGVIA